MVAIPDRMVKGLRFYKQSTVVVYVTMVELLNRGQRNLPLDLLADKAGVSRDEVVSAMNQLESTGIVTHPYVDGNVRHYVNVEPEM